jgi:hypothetical protein
LASKLTPAEPGRFWNFACLPDARGYLRLFEFRLRRRQQMFVLHRLMPRETRAARLSRCSEFHFDAKFNATLLLAEDADVEVLIA